jgi:hypothetical protein
MPETMSAVCVHHWVLGIPKDDADDNACVVIGRCKRCGTVREYPASLEDARKPVEPADSAPPYGAEPATPNVLAGAA